MLDKSVKILYIHFNKLEITLRQGDRMNVYAIDFSSRSMVETPINFTHPRDVSHEDFERDIYEVVETVHGEQAITAALEAKGYVKAETVTYIGELGEVF
jgi:hypothetical protein